MIKKGAYTAGSFNAIRIAPGILVPVKLGKRAP